MNESRRDFLRAAAWTAASLGVAPLAGRSHASTAPSPYKRIATQESFMTREVLGAFLTLLAEDPESEPGFAHFFESALGRPGELVAQLSTVLGGESTADLVNWISRTAATLGSEASVTALGRQFDLGTERLRIMDETGISMQVVSLGSPGVQVFERDQATDLARRSNDELAAAIRANPSRLAGLAAIAPQNSDAAARELDRAVRELDLKGVLINSHTKGEYLDEPKFQPILAKLDERAVPLYLHPRTPAPQMLGPFTRYPGLAGATFGFNVETSLHALRLILSGVFDDFPNLTVILGHMGEGLPFWIDRIDNRTAFLQTGPGTRPRELRKRPSDYLRENFYVTTSGMDFEPALLLAHRVVGPERIPFAIDYPMEDGHHPIKVLDEAPISDADKTLIYQTNAERVFGLSLS